MAISIIYKIENMINGKIYIGQSKLTLEQRLNNKWHGHFIRAFSKNSQQTVHIALRKYGKEAFTYEVIEECDNDKLDEREIHWIAYYKSNQKGFGYNATIGGKVGFSKSSIGRKYHHTEKTKHKMRLSALARKPMSQETKDKISKTKTGFKMTKEQKQRMSNAHKGLVKSDEHRANLSIARKGFKMTEEQKRKISESLKGKKYKSINDN